MIVIVYLVNYVLMEHVRLVVLLMLVAKQMKCVLIISAGIYFYLYVNF